MRRASASRRGMGRVALLLSTRRFGAPGGPSSRFLANFTECASIVPRIGCFLHVRFANSRPARARGRPQPILRSSTFVPRMASVAEIYTTL